MKLLRLNPFIFILLFFSHLELFPQQYNFTRMSVEDGLAQSQVWTLLQDSRGSIWMGTRGGGISVFNGISFTSYNSKNGLPNNIIWCIAEDKQKDIWIGTDDGLVRYDGIRFEQINSTSVNLKDKIQTLAFDKKGELWIGTSSSLIVFSGKDFRYVKDEEKKNIRNVSIILHDSKGHHWVGNDQGLFEFSNNTLIKHYQKKDGLSNLLVRTLTQDAGGNIWIGTYGGGVFIYNGKKIYRPEDRYELRSKIVHHLYADSKSTIWISTLSDGVYRFSTLDSTINWLSEKDGLSNDHVKAVLEDHWGNYWIGTSGGGVCKYSGQQFSHYSRMNGLPGDFIHSVFTDKEGRIWSGVADKGVCVYDSSKFKNFSAANIFKDVKVKTICEGPGRYLWFGTDGQGVFIKDSASFRSIKELNGKFIRDLQLDDSGRVWVATAGAGIYILKMDSTFLQVDDLSNITTRKGLPSNRILALHQDRKKRMWFGSEGGGAGFILSDTSIVTYDKTTGLSDNNIRCIAEDLNGNIWLGTNEYGINIIPGGNNKSKIDTVDIQDGLTSANIYLMVLDPEGNMYVGSENGIDLLTVNANGKIGSIRHMGRAEGFVGIETCQNAAAIDLKGNVWFGTINGITMYDPRTTIHNDKPPFLNITGINLLYESILETRFSSQIDKWFFPKGELILDPEENHLGFEFIAVNLPNPEGVHYKWKLDGLDKKWSPLSKNRSVTYSSLAPGKYTFHVRAINEDGVETKDTRSISFTILPPFWKTWWFITIMIGIGIGIIAFIFYLRVSRIKQKSDLLRKELQMEKNTLELEQKALRLQMNPHFIFNALNSIQSLIVQKDEKTARLYLSKFSRLMRMILDNSRQGMISLQSEINTLENYLSIEMFCSDDKFDFEIICNNNIPKDEIQLPPMMIQPFVENAVIHGIRHLDRKGKVKVEFKLSGNLLECLITDNGVGREKATEIRAQNEQHHKSTALVVTQERLDILNKDSGVRSLEILDLKDENGGPSGTCVVIRILQSW